MRRVDQAVYHKKGAAVVPPDYVLTPGGFRHRSLAHSMSPGNRVQRHLDRLFQVEMKTGKQISLYPRIPKHLIIPDVGTNWITYASWSNDTGSPISRFVTRWIVPPAPETENGQTIFIFSCLEDAVQDDIIQPVLQWGVAMPGGGNYWSIANWYIDHTGHATYSIPQRVNPGDTVTGIVTLVSQEGSNYNYRASFAEYPELDLPVNGVSELVWASETLEAYMMSECSDYPNASQTSMSSIEIQTSGNNPPLVWSVTNRVSDCNQRTAVVDGLNPGGQIDIFYS
jgi:hypothetical protein